MAESLYQEAYTALGVPGATAGSRFAGATISGSPTTGTFSVGDFVIDQTSGSIWVCTQAGTPGQWSFGDPSKLSLSGGTLTGTVSGVSATFSNAVYVSKLAVTGDTDTNYGTRFVGATVSGYPQASLTTAIKSIVSGTFPATTIFDSSGNIWIANTSVNSIVQIASGTSTIQTVLSGNLNGTPIVNPYGLALDSSGNLWFSNNNAASSTIGMVASGTTTAVAVLSGTILGGSTISQPAGIAFDSSGNLWIANEGLNNIIQVPSGMNTTISVLSGNINGAPLNAPTSLVIDNLTQNIWINNSGVNNITVNVSGTTFSTSVISGSANGITLTAQGLGVDKLSNVWVANFGTNSILQIVSGTRSAVSIISGTLNNFQFTGPNSVAIDSQSNIYVSTTTSNSLLRVASGVSNNSFSISYQAGDVVVDRTGSIWICTVSGTPGTWQQSGNVLTGGNNTFNGKNTFNGETIVQTPVFASDAANKSYVDTNANIPDIVPLDNLQYVFDGFTTNYTPTYQGVVVSGTNPMRYMLSVNGVMQKVVFPEWVWLSYLPQDGFLVDANGNLWFSEPPPPGSTFDARILPGPTSNNSTTIYPFNAADILLGA